MIDPVNVLPINLMTVQDLLELPLYILLILNLRFQEYLKKCMCLNLLQQMKKVCLPQNQRVELVVYKHKTPRQPIKDQETPKVNRKNWNAMMERELGEGYSFIKKKCFVCRSLSHLIKDCDYYEKKMAREAEFKKNKKKGPNIIFCFGQNINTGRININSVRSRVNTVTTNVNTVRSRPPVPTRTSNSFSPKRPQVNQFNQRRHFSKSYSSVRRPFAKTTAHSHAVKGNWGSAVKTSAGYNWRNSKPNSNCDSGPTFIRTVNAKSPQGRPKPVKAWGQTGNKDQLEDFEEFNGGSVTFGGSKGYISGKGKIRVGNLDFDSVSFVKELGHFNLFSISQICDKQHKVLFTETECLVVSSDFKMPDENRILLKGTSQTQNSNASEEKDEDVELIVVPSAVKNTEEKVESRTSSTNSKKQENKASSTDTSEDNPKILALRRELEEIALKAFKGTDIWKITLPLEIFHKSETGIFDEASYDEEGVITDFNSLPTEIEVSPTPTLRIHNIHPKSQILGDPKSAVWVLVDLPHGMKEEGIDYDEVFAHCGHRIEAFSTSYFLAFASFMGFIVYQMDVKSAFLYGTIDEEVYVSQPHGFVDPDHPKKVYIIRWLKLCMDCIKLLELGELTFFFGLQVKQNKTGIFISQDKYVAEILKKFDLVNVKTAITPIETKVALTNDEEAVDVDVTPKTSHLNAMKRIFRYLKGKPHLGIWYHRESPFDLEAFSNSDYGGSNLDMKSTKGGCQFLGQRLISWQCKKQTIVATSTTEAEYVATANCCGQVLWVQNQLLDYGFNFMNTKIHIDNESTICIVKNPMYHSKTCSSEIRPRFAEIVDFIRGSNLRMIESVSGNSMLFTTASDKSWTYNEALEAESMYFRAAQQEYGSCFRQRPFCSGVRGSGSLMFNGLLL
ncbi:putative ribonuclease H-like domain-containing protein [Tanacetum coccineum]|uniref:Ribonuclease H-like domain-containing protein n=1 Tax=Tanacetum coccineum TaxID=301880 RepID=A0ABQ4WJG6_9ASTR